MIVERGIPAEMLPKLLSGEYSLSGGTIRIAKGYPGGGQIVKHLVIPNPNALNQFVLNQQLFQSLQIGSIALQGMNLAISIAGFYFIVNKLKEINQHFQNLDYQIAQLREEVKEISFHQRLVEQSKLFANLENLKLASAINAPSLLSDSIGKLTESRVFYKSYCESLLQNDLELKEIYQDVSRFDSSIKMAIGAGIAQANALSNQGHLEESSHLIEDIKNWQNDTKDKLRSPIKLSSPAIWLIDLDELAKNDMKRVLKEQENIQHGLEYLLDHYQLCKEQNILPNELPVASDDEILLITTEQA
jgi:hypothetical protein